MRQARFILLFVLALFPLLGMAQAKFTERIQQRSASGGVVQVYQDAEIEELVNGRATATTASRDTASTTLAGAEKKVEKTSGPHTKENGFRVQIYMAGNTANDKAVAKSYAKRFKNSFPQVNAYVTFNSPHWICTVGDYKTRGEAEAMLKQVRRQFRSAYIIRSKINNFL